ncbi:MAG: hypothetical protein JW776_11585 [Candidatus Lokiarchaeota archaeon]|nr:hypothetical protein [Candidatus Lokiarchaeota archaeon]
MGKYTKRIINVFTIINVILLVGIALLLWGSFGTFDGELTGLIPGFIGMYTAIAAGIADVIYLIFVLVRYFIIKEKEH